MDVLWSPWRYAYIVDESKRALPKDACVFCEVLKLNDDEKTFILHRAKYNYVILNIYPYITGHLMIVPFDHTADLESTAKEITDEMMDLTRKSTTALREVYAPQGFNIGMNIGSAAGAGIAGHLHQHIIPRWSGDANFITTIGETRVIPEDLQTTYAKLKDKFR